MVLFYVLGQETCALVPLVAWSSLLDTSSSKIYPLYTGRKLNAHKTFRRHPGRLLNVLCTFNLRPGSSNSLALWKQRSQSVSQVSLINLININTNQMNDECIHSEKSSFTFRRNRGEQDCHHWTLSLTRSLKRVAKLVCIASVFYGNFFLSKRFSLIRQ